MDVQTGLHISMIGYAIYKSMRKISGYVVSGLMTAAIIVSYGIMIGGTVSVQRAVMMFLLHIVADIMGRNYDVLSAMSVALFLILLDNPLYIRNTGLQLSFMAIGGIVLVYPQVKEWLQIKHSWADAWIAGECVNVVTRPIVALSFYEISLYSSFTNLLVIPLMGVLVASGFSGMLMGLLHTGFGKLCILPGCIILKVYERVCTFMNQLPYASKITGIPDTERILLYYGMMIIGLALYVSFHKKNSRHTPAKMAMRRLSAVMIMILLFLVLTYRSGQSLKIQMLDVGQGDCICINDGNHVILTDGGSSSSKDIGTYTILPFLKASGVEQVDFLLITHTDADHVNGLDTVMEYRYHGRSYVKNIILPNIHDDVTDEVYRHIEEKAVQAGIHVLYFEKGSEIEFDTMCIQCISPDGGMGGDKNELSIVYYLKSKNITMLFTGDMGQSTEERLLKAELIQKADILKVGHHGSNGSSSEAFLQALRPKVGIISCGIHNLYGHPGQDTLRRLAQIGTDIYMTTECGQIDIVETKSGFYVESFLH